MEGVESMLKVDHVSTRQGFVSGSHDFEAACTHFIVL